MARPLLTTSTERAKSTFEVGGVSPVSVGDVTLATTATFAATVDLAKETSGDVALTTAFAATVDLSKETSGAAAVDTTFAIAEWEAGKETSAAPTVSTTFAVTGYESAKETSGSVTLSATLDVRLQLEGYQLVDSGGDHIVDDSGNILEPVFLTY